MGKAKKETRRGSPEAIAKRRAARSLNTLFAKSATVGAMDGRTLKRKRRLLKELQEGRGGQPIKAHEVLSHVTELLTLGETVGSIRKLKPKVPAAIPVNEETLPVIRETQESYNFDPRAWKFLGVDIERALGITPSEPEEEPSATRTRKKRAKKKAAA